MRSHVIPPPKLPNVPNDLFGFQASDFPISMGKDFCYSQLAQFVRSCFTNVVGKTDGFSLGSLSLRHHSIDTKTVSQSHWTTGPTLACSSGAQLARFDRDALSLPGVTHIVLLEGINDLGFPGAKLGELSLADPADIRSADDLIGAYRQLIARAHVRGIKLIGSTVTPCVGVDIPGYHSDAKEAVRQAVDGWIRNSGAFDGVIDFDAIQAKMRFDIW
jgi:hypothetical protein